MTLDLLDNIGVLTFDRIANSFPAHYHDTFCISFIEEGLEIIQLGERTLFTEAQQITICHPFEVHANPLFSHIGPAFTTLYIAKK